MVKSLKDQVVGPLPNGQTPWLINGGYWVTNHLLTGMILEVIIDDNWNIFSEVGGTSFKKNYA